MTTFPASVLTGATPDPDDEIVATWDAWRAEWLAYCARGQDDDTYLRSLDYKIVGMPVHGLRGAAAKAGYVLWHALDRDQMDGPFGFRATCKDMDWQILCAHHLARDLERLTGVVVCPTWDMGDSADKPPVTEFQKP